MSLQPKISWTFQQIHRKNEMGLKNSFTTKSQEHCHSYDFKNF